MYLCQSKTKAVAFWGWVFVVMAGRLGHRGHGALWMTLPLKVHGCMLSWLGAWVVEATEPCECITVFLKREDAWLYVVMAGRLGHRGYGALWIERVYRCLDRCMLSWLGARAIEATGPCRRMEMRCRKSCGNMYGLVGMWKWSMQEIACTQACCAFLPITQDQCIGRMVTAATCCESLSTIAFVVDSRTQAVHVLVPPEYADYIVQVHFDGEGTGEHGRNCCTGTTVHY